MSTGVHKKIDYINEFRLNPCSKYTAKIANIGKHHEKSHFVRQYKYH